MTPGRRCAVARTYTVCVSASPFGGSRDAAPEQRVLVSLSPRPPPESPYHTAQPGQQGAAMDQGGGQGESSHLEHVHQVLLQRRLNRSF